MPTRFSDQLLDSRSAALLRLHASVLAEQRYGDSSAAVVERLYVLSIEAIYRRRMALICILRQECFSPAATFGQINLRKFQHHMYPLTYQKTDSIERSRLLAKAISRWDSEGGAGINGNYLAGSAESLTDALPLTNAELVQLQIRVIALENMLAVLMADASDRQLKLVREIADCITPQPGFTPHPLTIHAAARMLGFIERSAHLRTLQIDEASDGDSPNDGLDSGCAT